MYRTRCKYVCVRVDRSNIDFKQLYSKQGYVDTTLNTSSFQLISTSASVCIFIFSPPSFHYPICFSSRFRSFIVLSGDKLGILKHFQNCQCIPKDCYNNIFKLSINIFFFFLHLYDIFVDLRLKITIFKVE